MSRAATAGSWPKGHSGNPNGRPRGTPSGASVATPTGRIAAQATIREVAEALGISPASVLRAERSGLRKLCAAGVFGFSNAVVRAGGRDGNGNRWVSAAGAT